MNKRAMPEAVAAVETLALVLVAVLALRLAPLVPCLPRLRAPLPQVVLLPVLRPQMRAKGGRGRLVLREAKEASR